jgi:hypothetical protein
VTVIQEIFQCPLRRIEDESIKYNGLWRSQTIIFDTLILYPPQRTLKYLLDDRHRPLVTVIQEIFQCPLRRMEDESIKYNGL